MKKEMKDATYYQEKILKMFEDSAGKYSMVELFNDFIEWNFVTIHTLQEGDFESFKKTRKWFLNKYDLSYFELFNNITDTLKEGLLTTHEDILGVVFMSMNPNKKLKQFFTPQCLCDLITVLTFGTPEDLRSRISEEKGISCSDPTCGTGANLISVVKYARNNHINTNQILLLGKDIDKRCAQITFLQLELLSANAIIQVGDTLLNTTSDTYMTTTQYIAQYGKQNLVKNLLGYLDMIEELKTAS